LLNLAGIRRILERLNMPARQIRFWPDCRRDRPPACVIEPDFEFLPDSREVHDRWRALLVAQSVQGVQVHDTRLAASMYVHGVGQLLTINVRDFRRFEGLRVLHPTEVQDVR
jgi:hypothetical protein